MSKLTICKSDVPLEQRSILNDALDTKSDYHIFAYVLYESALKFISIHSASIVHYPEYMITKDADYFIQQYQLKQLEKLL